MSDPRKDFTAIQADYEFFATHSTEAEADLAVYVARLRSYPVSTRPVRMLDFGCGPGTFTERFLETTGWQGGELDLALVEPSSAYRQQAVERLAPKATRPVAAYEALPPDSAQRFDLIVSNHVLYYVPALDTTLARILDALAPNGQFLTAVADRDNALVDLWFRGFPLIGRPVPYHTAEDVEAALIQLSRPFECREVRYDVRFPDTEENRLKILRFLFGDHLAALPNSAALALLDLYAEHGDIVMHTGNRQYHVSNAT